MPSLPSPSSFGITNSLLCCPGQETIAKVHNLGAVKQELWGLAVTGPVEPGAEIWTLDRTEKVGRVTSSVDVVVDDIKRCYALGYLRTKARGNRPTLEGYVSARSGR